MCDDRTCPEDRAGQGVVAGPNVTGSLDVLKPGLLVRTRLVPVRDFYMFSGAMSVYAAEERRSLLRKLKLGGVALPDSGSKRWTPSPDHPASRSDPRPRVRARAAAAAGTASAACGGRTRQRRRYVAWAIRGVYW